MHLKLGADSPAALKRKTGRERVRKRDRKERSEATERPARAQKKEREGRRGGTTRWTISGTPLPHDAFITATIPRCSLPRFRDCETPRRACERENEWEEEGRTARRPAKGRKWNKARARSSKLLRRGAAVRRWTSVHSRQKVRYQESKWNKNTRDKDITDYKY